MISQWGRQCAKKFFDNRAVLNQSFWIDLRAVGGPSREVLVRWIADRRILQISKEFSYHMMSPSKAVFDDIGLEEKWRQEGFGDVTPEEALERADEKIAG
jgi:hypothetical protein